MLILNATGRLAKDSELKYIPGSGKAVLNFGLVSNRVYSKDKENPSVDIIKCQLWGTRAESLSAYLTKGYLVQIVGELQSNKDATGTVWWQCMIKDIQLLSKPFSQQNIQNKFDPTIEEDDIPF